MSLKTRSLLVIVVGTVLGLTLSLGGHVLADREPSAAMADGLPVEEARLLAEVLERVRREYVESVDERELIESAIRGMLSGLDPHSQFLDVKEFDEIRVSTTGQYTGVGLEVAAESGRITVVTPLDGSPAQRAGLRPGDVLISIDGMPLDGRDLGDAVARMRGRPGTHVALSVVRDGVEEPLSFDLLRDRIEVHSVSETLLERDFGYVRVTHFSDTTAPDLRRAVAALEHQNGRRLRGLVLDLRNNPGGVLDAAVDVADAFLDRGVIVSGDGRIRDAHFERHARRGDILEGAGMVVLVNTGSASASEIVAGALQDHNRATLIGMPTYGKGSVQTVMPLSGGRAIKLTTARYYTPSGASIHERGIRPDLLIEDRADGRTVAGFGPAQLDADYQLQEALQWLKSAGVMHSRAR
jgi:carboxyl-terminal processing protease